MENLMSEENQTTVDYMKTAAAVLNIAGYLLLILVAVLSLPLVVGVVTCMFGIAATTLSFWLDIKRLKIPSITLSLGIWVVAFTVDYLDYLSRVSGK
jgi:hypothetical protein